MVNHKVIIAGGRDYNDYQYLEYMCEEILQGRFNIEIVSGGANGADKLGEQFALENSYPVTRFPADWNLHGKKAGPLRNIQMAEYADELIAFWDGKSKGTKHMIDEATRQGLIVNVVKYGE
jgi:hypothetical protein